MFLPVITTFLKTPLRVAVDFIELILLPLLPLWCPFRQTVVDTLAGSPNLFHKPDCNQPTQIEGCGSFGRYKKPVPVSSAICPWLIPFPGVRPTHSFPKAARGCNLQAKWTVLPNRVA